MTITLYALRHKATGLFMPAKMSRGARGYSYWNPGVRFNGDKPYDPSPRLFRSTRAAGVARGLWAAGQWEHQYADRGTYWDQDDYRGVAPEKPPVERKPDDLEIVTMHLVEVIGGR